MQVEQSSHKNKTLYFLILISIAVLVFSISFLIHEAKKDARVHFLSFEDGAEWIMYPLALSTKVRENQYETLIADFSHSFSLEQIPPDIMVHIRAFQEFDIYINGQQVPNPPNKDANWKAITQLSVSPYLLSGINNVRVIVKANYGPPSLWLRFSGLSEKISTDDKWLVSINEAPPFNAIRSDDTRLHGISSKFPKPIDAIKRVYMKLIFFFLFGAMVYIALFLNKPSNMNTKYALIKKNILTPNSALMVVTLFWTALFINNIKYLPVDVGFDANSHIQYLNYIINNKALPLANDLFQGYQPPLFYLINAIIIPIAEKILSFPSLNYAFKITSFLSGFGQVIIAFFAGRIVFREDKIGHSLLILISGLIPMNIYISHYFSNEPFSAFLISFSILMTLFILDSPKPLSRHFALLGLSIALALLTKYTVLVILPILFFSVLFNYILIQKTRFSTLFLQIFIVIFIIVSLSGWFYLRNYVTFGKLLIGNWDYLISDWWQDPGFHTTSYFASFGNVFSFPYFSGFYSFWDSIYATFWGDSLIGGRAASYAAPLWNYEYMTVIYLISIPATLFFIIGILKAIYQIILNMDIKWLLCIGSNFLFILSLVHMNLINPFYAQAKAFYILGALLPITLLFTYGLKTLSTFTGKLKIFLNCIVSGWLFTLAISIFLAFLIPPNQKQLYNDIENMEAQLEKAIYHMKMNDFQAAKPYFKAAIELGPNFVMCRTLYADALFKEGLINDAIKHFEEALRIEPDYPEAHRTRNNLGIVLLHKGDIDGAIEQFRKALQINPKYVSAKNNLNKLLPIQKQ